MKIRSFLMMMAFAGAPLLLSACGGEKAIPLQGERLSVLELQEDLIADDQDALPAMELPDAWKNEFWPQVGGYPNHSMQNLALGHELQPVWRTRIGKGGNDDIPLMAQPIVVNGMVVTLDSSAYVRAFDVKDGSRIWEQGAGFKKDDDPVLTGGIAYGDQKIFMTNGYNEVYAMDYKTGKLLWQRNLPGPSQVAPTILDGRVYVLTIDNSLLAFATHDGAPLWEYSAVSEGTGVVGSAAPAANREVVVAAFSSGEVTALRVENGSSAWTENLDTIGRFGGIGSIADIKAAPVIDKGLLVAMNYSGRMAAMDLRSGRRIWQRDIGGENMPWIAGESIFVVSSENTLIAMNRKTGLIYWIKPLQNYMDPDDADEIVHWHGPMLAGDRLILVSSEGRVVEASPETGDILSAWEVGRDVPVSPTIAGGRMYLISEDGMLRVYQ
tara:strand:- start:7951 stop:9267 length:1317 start_codon:yes stop_codon:yes gene_type:complete